MTCVHDWLFHYNDYTGNWEAAKRENYTDLFSNRKENVLSSGNLNTLVELIEKTDGDAEKIKKLLKVNNG